MAGNSASATAKLTVTYWRDIPAQITAKAGRANARRELSPRFQDAIDRAAMKSGAHGTDAYLEGWRKGKAEPCGADLEKVVDEAAAQIEQEFNGERLSRLIAAGGRKNGGHE